jgi:glycosyltransferase involved in cell wall biosynthesis
MDSPKITVITPTYNAAATLAVCIESVANQSYPHKEHLIIDGLSTDSTLQIVQQYAVNYPHIRYISEKDNGIYDAMNKGITLANGEWVYFLGADDHLFDNNVLQSIFDNKELIRNDLIYGNVFLKQTQIMYGQESDTRKILDITICHQATFYRKALFKKLGDYIVRYKVAADWAFNIKCFGTKNIKIRYIDQPIAFYNQTGFSSDKIDHVFMKERWEYILDNAHHSIPLPELLVLTGKCPLPILSEGNLLKGWLEIFRTVRKFGHWVYYFKNGLYWTINHK